MKKIIILLSVLVIMATTAFAIDPANESNRFSQYVNDSKYTAYIDTASFSVPIPPKDNFSCLQVDTYVHSNESSRNFGQTKRFFYDHLTKKIYLQIISFVQYDVDWNVVQNRQLFTSTKNIIEVPEDSLMYTEAAQAYKLKTGMDW
jgi:uncharacterized protein YxeA